MIVTAALSWWNESPEDLDACVRGLATVCDRLVAVDGGWARWPGATERSAQDQWDAIADAADAVGLEYRIAMNPAVLDGESGIWAGQVAKRSFLMAEAAKDSDWICVVDADHILHGDRAAARAQLAAMPDDVLVVNARFWTPPNAERDLRTSAATYWHAGMSGATVEFGHIIRALPGMRCQANHWVYIGERDGHEVTMLYGVVGIEGPVMAAPYLVEHRTLFRDEAHIDANRRFCADRDLVVALTGQEDDRPELPRPAWG